MAEQMTTAVQEALGQALTNSDDATSSRNRCGPLMEIIRTTG